MNRTELRLVLTGYWFDEIDAGRKGVEFRDITLHWSRRIWARRAEFKTVRFSRGYTKKTIMRQVTAIDKGRCFYRGWDGVYYRIWFEDATDKKGR